MSAQYHQPAILFILVTVGRDWWPLYFNMCLYDYGKRSVMENHAQALNLPMEVTKSTCIQILLGKVNHMGTYIVTWKIKVIYTICPDRRKFKHSIYHQPLPQPANINLSVKNKHLYTQILSPTTLRELEKYWYKKWAQTEVVCIIVLMVCIYRLG